VLEQHGWRLLRIQGSHHIYGKEGSIVRLSVPIHGGCWGTVQSKMTYKVYGKYVKGIEEDAGRIREYFANGFFDL